MTKIVFLTIFIFISFVKNSQAQTQNCEQLSNFIDRITLGITENESIKSFSNLKPQPHKLSKHVYGALCILDNESIMIGMFVFFSNKLALSQAQIISTNKKIVDDAYSFAKNELNNSNITDQPICPTVDMCTWAYLAADYSISIGRVYHEISQGELNVFIESRRKDSLVSNSNFPKSELTKEMTGAINKLNEDLPPGHILNNLD